MAASVPELARTKVAAEWCFRSSQNELGWMYATGTRAKKNGNEAVKWLTKAAAQGDKSAQFDICYGCIGLR